ncbi:hypothetical protein [Sphingopyxis sp. KK2]|uniref:hypothetical protein n=1 Tax=Sphingopyxis sp. KK2 TaxID=1855727 RepID=UPI00097E6187|nr:hypothetical protein [Sphingopyxis sp. KK2]
MGLGAITAAPAHAAANLPIAPGLYAEDFEGCTKATGIFFYDGTNFGNVNQGAPGYKAYAKVNPITRTGPAPGSAETSRYYKGYTLAWSAEDTGLYGSLAVKAGAQGKFMKRTVSFLNGSGGTEVDDGAFTKCNFSQLSPQMQAAIRTARPQLAEGNAAAAPAPAAMPAPVAPFNVRPGHYAPVAAACGSARELLFYYDGKRAGWVDMQPFNPARMNAVASAKRRGAGWITDAATGETLRVLGIERIAVGDPEFGEETLRWCPADQVRQTARPR